MPFVATQTAYGDVIESVSLGSPVSPNTSSKDWRQTQRPSWLLIANRRSGMSMKKHWTMKHVITETEEYINTESALRKDILSGVDPQEAYLKYRVF